LGYFIKYGTNLAIIKQLKIKEIT